MITLEETKLHCRVDHDADDVLLSKYIDAARENVSQYISRALFDDEASINVEDGIVINRAIELAMLLLVGHWYAHRESVSEVSMQEIPHGVHNLLQPYRMMGV